MKQKILYWIGLAIAILTAVVTYMSCTTVITTQRRPNSATQSTTVTTTQVVDSVSVSPKIN